MYNDLTDSFHYALTHAEIWTRDAVNDVVNLILDRLASATDAWDAASGEDWVQFVAGEQIVLYLSANFPLAIVLLGAESLLDGVSVVIVIVDDFDRTRFSIDPALLPGIAAHPAPDGALDANGFTIQQLRRMSL